MKLRTGEPWMTAEQYGRSLRGFTVNLLVREIDKALVFQREVLKADVLYSDADFAALKGYGAEWMLHADHTYGGEHPMTKALAGILTRGVGVELRLQGCDPEAAEQAARRLGFAVMANTSNKPHGLREAYLQDADGYIWVPGVPIQFS